MVKRRNVVIGAVALLILFALVFLRKGALGTFQRYASAVRLAPEKAEEAMA